MKVLVTGARGQIGRALVNSAPAYVKVRPYGRMQLNITDARAVAECVQFHKPDVIVNAAGFTCVDRAESAPEHASRVNSKGPRYLAMAARDAGARLIHISTNFVFDGEASAPYLPTAATNPLGVYGLTKRNGEDAVLKILPERSVILRTAWIYAAEGHNFLNTILRIMRTEAPPRVVVDQVGTPTSAESVAAVIWNIIGMPEMNGIHHWTDTGIASRYDFALAIAEEATALGVLPRAAGITPVTTAEFPTPARRPHYNVLDKTSLTSLGINSIHWRNQLRDVLQEIKNA
jgi:dTDP-4-dehydrorhamnose reductase